MTSLTVTGAGLWLRWAFIPTLAAFWLGRRLGRVEARQGPAIGARAPGAGPARSDAPARKLTRVR